MSSDVKKDNPAGRLFHILSFLMQQNTLKDRPFSEVVAHKYNLEKGDAIGITLIHLALLNLIKETRFTVHRLGLSEMYTQPIDELQSKFSSIGLNHQWSNYLEFLQPSVLTSLKFISDRLSSSILSEPRLSEDEVGNLIVELHELTEEVKSGEMDFQLKILLLERIEGIKRSLEEYLLGFKGNDIFGDEFAHTLGFVILHQNEIRNLGKEEKGKTIRNKLGKLLANLQTIVATVAVKELVSEGIKKLPELMDFIEQITK